MQMEGNLGTTKLMTVQVRAVVILACQLSQRREAVSKSR